LAAHFCAGAGDRPATFENMADVVGMDDVEH
jgi:hypothetical protein